MIIGFAFFLLTEDIMSLSGERFDVNGWML